jgi:hypothetical protein
MSEKRTPLGKFIHSSWINLNIRAGNGKYHHLATRSKCKSYVEIDVLFSREEYKNFCILNENNILKLSRPSLDRKDNNKHYTLENIQFIELKDNIRKEKLTFNEKLHIGTCFKCKETKDVSLFAIDRRRINKHSSMCKKCDNARKII